MLLMNHRIMLVRYSLAHDLFLFIFYFATFLFMNTKFIPGIHTRDYNNAKGNRSIKDYFAFLPVFIIQFESLALNNMNSFQR